MLIYEQLNLLPRPRMQLDQLCEPFFHNAMHGLKIVAKKATFSYGFPSATSIQAWKRMCLNGACTSGNFTHHICFAVGSNGQ
jgi:hypothetical protein